MIMHSGSGWHKPPAYQPDLFSAANRPTIAYTPEILTLLLDRHAAVSVSVSGGKDGAATALGLDEFLNEIGHKGPRLLIHADLGEIEWEDSLPSCQRLADHLGWQLVVVQRRAGGMIQRWHQRWRNNIRRYEDLSCVRLILPWSTPDMRFCTSELKTAVIISKLKTLFPDRPILNVTGIRRQEGQSRQTKPVAAPNKNLTRHDRPGVTWNPILDWKVEQVFDRHVETGMPLHEGYSRYDASRISCKFCIMSSQADLAASARVPAHAPVYRTLVELEIASTFGFQGNIWLADIAPHLLSHDMQEQISLAKNKARKRQAIEAAIPEHLKFVKGWPTIMPTPGEAEGLAEVRASVSTLMGLNSVNLTGPTVLARYDQLMRDKATKAAAKTRRV